jgi:hypothetical protein
LNARSLWCQIEAVNIHPQFVAEMLRRSRLHPLSLELNFDTNDRTIDQFTVARAWLCGPQYRRVKSLTLNGVDGLYEGVIFNLLAEEMPLLEKLEMTYGRKTQQEATNKLIPTSFLSSQPPIYLMSVILKKYIFSSWSKPYVSPNLTNLVISLEKPLRENLPSLNQLTDLLSSLTQLQHLHLRDVVPHEPLSNTDSQIHLSANLKSLFLNGFHLGNQTASLWTHLVVPSSTQVRVCLRKLDVRHATPAGHSLSTLSSESLHQELIVSRTSINFYHYTRVRDEWKIALPTPPHFLLSRSGGLHMGIILGQTSPDSNTEVVTSITPFILQLKEKFSELSAIELSGDVADWLGNDDAWTTAFKSARSVSRLSISFESASNTLLALSRHETIKNGMQPSVEFSLFPALETLFIVEHAVKVTEIWMDEFSSWLIHCLQVRREHGAAIQEVVTTESLINLHLWHAIKKEVLVTFI